MNTGRTNTGALIGGALLIGVGLLALLGQFFDISWGNLWPFFVIGPGVLFFVAMFAGGKSTAPLAIPGSIITMVGLILFFQTVTGHWESWSYAWALIIVAVGLGVYISGVWSGSAGQRKSGWDITKVGLILFVIFGSFFELIFSGFRRSLLQSVFPALLILVGLYLAVGRSGLLKSSRAQVIEPPAVESQEPAGPEQTPEE